MPKKGKKKVNVSMPRWKPPEKDMPDFVRPRTKATGVTKEKVATVSDKRALVKSKAKPAYKRGKNDQKKNPSPRTSRLGGR